MPLYFACQFVTRQDRIYLSNVGLSILLTFNFLCFSWGKNIVTTSLSACHRFVQAILKELFNEMKLKV